MTLSWFVSVGKPNASKYYSYDQKQYGEQDQNRLGDTKITQNELWYVCWQWVPKYPALQTQIFLVPSHEPK
jgi:hypothetical protein